MQHQWDHTPEWSSPRYKLAGLLSLLLCLFCPCLFQLCEVSTEPNLHIKWLTHPLVKKWPTFPPSRKKVLSLTSTDKKQLASTEDEMLLCPYCVTFRLDLGCDRPARSSSTVQRGHVGACHHVIESKAGRMNVYRDLLHTATLWEPDYNKCNQSLSHLGIK